MRWGWLIGVGFYVVQFVVAAVLVPDMCRRKVQW